MTKTFFTVCAVVVCALFLGSCEKDSIESPSPNDSENFYGYKIKDIAEIDKESLLYTDPYGEGSDSSFIFGLKQKKIWIGCFDTNSKEQLCEWNGSEQLSDSIKRVIHMSPHSHYARFETYSGNTYDMLLFFNKDNSVKHVSLNYCGFNIQEYNDAIYVYNRDLDDCDLYSLNGTMIISSASQCTTGDSTFFSGFYNDKVRFRLYNEQTKKLRQEWNGEEKFNRSIKFYEGYGEYSNYNVDFLSLCFYNNYNSQPNILYTSWGIAVVPEYKQKSSKYPLTGDLFFLNENKAICYHLDDSTNRSSGVDIKEWYKESILLKFRK